MAVSAGRTNIGNREHQTAQVTRYVTPYHPVAHTWLCQPVETMVPRRMHQTHVGWLCQPVACKYKYMAVSAGRIDEENAYKHLWVGCVSLLPAAFKYMAVSAGCTNMAVSAGRIDVTCSGANTCGLAVSAGGTMHLMFFFTTHVKP